jgi:hypothetical protein
VCGVHPQPCNLFDVSLSCPNLSATSTPSSLSLLLLLLQPEELALERGWALAAHYDYLKGVDNDLALRHVPEVAPRNDTLAGEL